MNLVYSNSYCEKGEEYVFSVSAKPNRGEGASVRSSVLTQGELALL